MILEEVIQEINNHPEKSQKNYHSGFYSGIINDIKRRLFDKYNVLRKKH